MTAPEGKPQRLHVPELDDDVDVLGAALTYAKAGWYVGPMHHEEKNPGRVLGKGWQTKTSREPEEIVGWFAGTPYGLFLHVGRSGGLVLDVDDYEALMPEVAQIITDKQPPFQSTRDDDRRRGHYVFAMPDDRLLGNSKGQLGKAWGEVRGVNGIIVVQPTRHEKDNGRYLWISTGKLPSLGPIADLLPNVVDSEDPATDKVVRAFMDEHTDSTKHALLKVCIDKMKRDIEQGGSRHDALRDQAIWAMREAHAGFYPAAEAHAALWKTFKKAMEVNPTPGRFVASEFSSLIAWAVAQAIADDAEERRKGVTDRIEEVQFLKRQPMEPVADPADPAVVADPPKKRPPEDYFWDKSAGVDVEMLADDVIATGPLLTGRDGMFWEYKGGVWAQARDEVRGRCTELLRGRYRGSHATNTEHVVHRKVGRIEGEPVSDFVNFRGDAEGNGGGMLQWRTGDLMPHSPSYLSTVQLPLAWDPTATCPRFDTFLKGILTDDYVALVWEMLGYLLMSGNPLQQAFLFHGTGQNGKGVLMRVITALLGQENISAVSLDQLNNNRFAAAALYGKTANIAGDIDATYQESTAAFKSLTGEDTYSTEYKHRDAFTFTSWAVPVFSANEIPGSADVSEGYLRRWTVIHFHRHITEAEKIERLSDLLVEELPGIAVKAIEHLRALMERGHFDKTTGDVAEGMRAFADRIDQVRQWVDQMCEPLHANREKATDVYASYKAWAESTGSGKLSAEKFYGRLAGAGYPMRKVNGTRFIEGLRVVDQRMKDPMTASHVTFMSGSNS